jgi:hypothetical protein
MNNVKNVVTLLIEVVVSLITAIAVASVVAVIKLPPIKAKIMTSKPMTNKDTIKPSRTAVPATPLSCLRLPNLISYPPLSIRHFYRYLFPASLKDVLHIPLRIPYGNMKLNPLSSC